MLTWLSIAVQHQGEHLYLNVRLTEEISQLRYIADTFTIFSVNRKTRKLKNINFPVIGTNLPLCFMSFKCLLYVYLSNLSKVFAINYLKSSLTSFS